MTSRTHDWVDGAIDLHVHTAPDLIERYQTDFELATASRSRGMKAIVVKSHVFPTVGRVEQANQAIGSELLFGGITLNGTVGGLNPSAVEAALRLGAKIVWFPTVWATNHASQAREQGVSTFAGLRVPSGTEEITVTEDGNLIPEAKQIISLAAEYDAVVGTGHISSDEIFAVADACRDRGVNCLINHPFFSITDLSLPEQQQLADWGSTLEYCYYSVSATDGHSVDEVAAAINELGPSNCAIATDYGQRTNSPVDGLSEFAEDLMQAGLSEAAIRTVLADTPSEVLGI